MQEYLLAGALEMGHARALLALPVAQQAGAAARVVERELSVRETERLVHALLNPAKRAARRSASRGYDADTARLENELAEKLGAVVHIEPGRQGAGRLVIRYSTLEQLDGILARFEASNRAARADDGALARVAAQPSCFSIVSASDTSYLPGASMLSAFTTPLSTSIEKRWQRTPMPRAVESSSRPSAFV